MDKLNKEIMDEFYAVADEKLGPNAHRPIKEKIEIIVRKNRLDFETVNQYTSSIALYDYIKDLVGKRETNQHHQTLDSFFGQFIQVEEQAKNVRLAATWVTDNSGFDVISYENFLEGYDLFCKLVSYGFNQDYLLKFAKLLIESSVVCHSTKEEKHVGECMGIIENYINLQETTER